MNANPKRETGWLLRKIEAVAEAATSAAQAAAYAEYTAPERRIAWDDETAALGFLPQSTEDDFIQMLRVEVSRHMFQIANGSLESAAHIQAAFG